METVPKDKLDNAVEEELDLPVEDPKPEGPKPKPGEAGYDWAAQYPGVENLYLHTFPDGTVVGLKPFSSIYSKTWLYKLRKATSDVDIEFAALDRGSCDVARAVLESLPDTDGDPLSDLFKAWAAAASDGLTPGE